jgi:ABC-type dipeptide/oligopeptide/nickel transport system ATPase component
MDNIKKIKTHLNADVPLLILGESGWGKSALVQEIAQELKIPLVIANSNSWTAEDFGGLVRPTKKGDCYEYLPPKWVIENKDREFILFIDEINQANISVLHALYRIVLDREVAGIKLKMKIIAAGNNLNENPYLTELPVPLLKRFSLYHWEKNVTDACNYLNLKYNINLTEIYTTPRQTEMAIKMYRAGDIDSAQELGGEQLLSFLRKERESEGKKLIKEIETNEVKRRNGYL